MRFIPLKSIGVLGFLTTLIIPVVLSLIMTLGVLASSTLSGLATSLLAKAGVETAESVLTRQNQQLRSSNKLLDKKLKNGRAVATRVQGNVVKRAKKSAKRNVLSMPAEAIPIIGLGTIVAVTALELDDMCAIMEYVDELTSALELESSEPTEVQQYCSSWRAELQQTAKSLESAEASMRSVWGSARDSIGESMYNACRMLGTCQELNISQPQNTPAAHPPQIQPNLYDEMVNQTSDYFGVIGRYWGF